MGDENIEARCQSIYRNLLRASEAVLADGPLLYVRELRQTSRCDQFYDFSKIRDSYATKLGKDRMQRVESFKQTSEDEEVVAQTVFHYRDWDEYNLLSALSWPNWLWYHTMHRAERTLAMIGIATIGYRFIRSSHRRWQPAQQQQPVQPAAQVQQQQPPT